VRVYQTIFNSTHANSESAMAQALVNHPLLALAGLILTDHSGRPKFQFLYFQCAYLKGVLTRAKPPLSSLC